MDKEVKFGRDVRVGLMSGVDKLVDPVKITLGAKGKLVGIYDSRSMKSHVTKDGYTIAKSIEEGSNKLKSLAISLVNEAIAKTNEDVGDATTTTAILCQKLINQGLKSIEVDVDPMKLKKGMDDAMIKTIAMIKEVSVPVDDMIRNIATISGNNNLFIGDTIAEAFMHAGNHEESSIKVVLTDEPKTIVETVSGYKLEKGFLRDDFINHVDGDKCVYENPYILMVHGKIDSFRDFIPLIEKVAHEGRPLVIMADKFEGEFLNSVAVSMQSQLRDIKAGKSNYFQHIGLVQNPMALQSASELYGDISPIIGQAGSYLNVIVNDIEIADLGEADTVEINRTNTIIRGGRGSKEGVDKRLKQLTVQMDNDDLTPFQEAIIRERIESLSGSHAYIRVGGDTPAEAKELKDLFDDAFNAVRASLKEGVTAGGGSTLLRIADHLRKNIPMYDVDVARGWQIFIEAIEAPFYQVMENANEKPDVIKEKILQSRVDNCGYNVLTKQYVNMIDEGIIDPAMAERVAIENAVAVAGLMYNMDAVVLEKIG